MFRAAIAGAVLTAVATTAPAARAQFGGMSIPTAPIPQQAGGASNVFFPVVMPWGWGLGWGYQTYNPWVGYGYSYGGIVPPGYTAPQPVFVERPLPPEPTVVLANAFPATLTAQFPAAAEVWLDGKKLAGAAAEERVLTSPVLGPNRRYAFKLKARWTGGGKTYETTRTVTLGGGDRSRLVVLSGDEVKE
jgi:uncharacterized protein (TIGR03000 family)